MSTEAERPPDMGFTRSRPAPDDVDEPFRQSLADLTRQLAARGPIEVPAFDPRADVDLPREPTRPARTRRRRRPFLGVLALALGVALAAVIHVWLGAPREPQPARPIAMAPPLPAPVASPTAAEIAPPARVTVDPPPPPAAPVIIAAPEPPPPKAKLEAYEIMEIQTRLKAIGLSPGPLDGLSGQQTVAAIKQYEASKGQPQTGKASREVLKLLRQEPERTPAKEPAPPPQ